MLGDIVIGRERIETIVADLAARLNRDLAGKNPVFIGVLKGCIYFFTDLTSRVDHAMTVDFIQVASYGASTTSSGSVVLVKDITTDIRDRDVYMVEDIVDTGITLTDVMRMLEARHPRSLSVVAFLSKPSRRKVPIEVTYLGCEIDDLFVVGYGLDFDERYRNVPDVHVFVPDGA